MHTRCGSQAQNSWDASSKPLSVPFYASFDTEFPCLSSVSFVALFLSSSRQCLQDEDISEKLQEAGKRRETDESDVFYRGAATPTRRTPNKG
jgi:hypothetical protein